MNDKLKAHFDTMAETLMSRLIEEFQDGCEDYLSTVQDEVRTADSYEMTMYLVRALSEALHNADSEIEGSFQFIQDEIL